VTTTVTQTRFDRDALLEMAGRQSFDRGCVYADDDRVHVLEVSDLCVIAQVTGTRTYLATLTGRCVQFQGHCTCPAFDDSGFCKHLVAAALAVNRRPPDGREELPLERIRRHLRSLDAEALLEMTVEAALRDDRLFQRLDLFAAGDREDEAGLVRRLKAAIDDVGPPPEVCDKDDLRDWVCRIDDLLTTIEDLIDHGRATVALDLAAHLIDRIDEGIEDGPDGEGCMIGRLEGALELHCAAAEAAKPDPEALAERLYAWEIHDAFGTFHGLLDRYAEILGDSGLAAYRRLAERDWAEMPPARAGTGSAERTESDYKAARRRRIVAAALEFFAERDGDLDARIAVRARTLESAHDYLSLARFCLENGRPDDARRWVDEGLFLFEDSRQAEDLALFAAERWVEDGALARAGDLLARRFRRHPSWPLYQAWRDLAGAAARDAAVALLQDRSAARKPAPWPRPCDLLVQVLTAEGMHHEAWQAALHHKVDENCSDALAEASVDTCRAEVLAYWSRRIEVLVDQGGNARYDAAAALVRRMANLRPAEDQARHVADLRARHKMKRNFMKRIADA